LTAIRPLPKTLQLTPLELEIIGMSRKLAKDGQVFYHVVILSDDEANPVKTHVLVNAIDGTIFKVGKELPRTMRNPEQR